MRYSVLAVLIPLACVAAPLSAQARVLPRPTAAALQPLGIRELRAEFLPAPFAIAWVAATDEGLVELVFDEGLARRSLESTRAPRASREFFEPWAVLQWVDRTNQVVQWVVGGVGDVPPAARLGYDSGGVSFEASAVVVDGRRQARFMTTRCGMITQETVVDPRTMVLTASLFRRAAGEAARLVPRPVPGNPVWAEHAVGCAAVPFRDNAEPAWPSAAPLRPHQELVRVVVDVNGRVVPGSDQFMPSSRPEFVASVRATLPAWRFTPATRLGRRVRQAAHVNVTFRPPVTLATSRACPNDRGHGVVARIVPGQSEDPGEHYLTEVARVLSTMPIAQSANGATIRFRSWRHQSASDVRLVPGTLDRPLTRMEEMQVSAKAPELFPMLPWSVAGNAVVLEVEFGFRCERMFSAPAEDDVLSFVPQGDGMVRIAKVPESIDQPFPDFPTFQREFVPAATLRDFVERASVLIANMDTTGPRGSDPAREFPPGAPVIGREIGPGLHMWFTSYGWIRAGMNCPNNVRFAEVSPTQFADVLRAARAALDLVPRQARWSAPPGRAHGEHELTCDLGRVGRDVMPVLSTGSPSQASLEVVTRFVVDTEGRVERASIEFLPGPDSLVQDLVASAISQWTFRPAVAAGRRVRAATYVVLPVRPMDADAILLAASPPENPASARPRTIFFKPNAPPDRPVRITTHRDLAELESDVRPHIESARRTWPGMRDRFLRGLSSNHELFVTARLTDAFGRMEQVFVRVERIATGTIHGRVNNDVSVVLGWRRGDAITIPESEIIDWTLSLPDGREEGNYVGKFLDTRRPPG